MKLLAIIVNYKTADMTLQALEHLMRELAPIPSAKVIIVDNDSQDGSYEKLRDALAALGNYDGRVEVQRSDKNGGFGYGNNWALRQGLAWKDPPDYFYLLNSDAFPEKNSIKILVDHLDKHPEVGIAGSYIHGPEGTPHETAFRFPSVQSELEATLGLGVVSKLLEEYIVALPMPKETTQVDWLAGASMMIRRQVLEQIGLFDETFFLYFEEVDLCRRARIAGWPTHYVVESSVAHIGSASTGMKNLKNRTPSYWFDSRRHYWLKNHGRLGLAAANVTWVVGFSVGRLREKIQGKPDLIHRPKMLQDFIKHNFTPFKH
jgi:N-acetylglucosaminyl-diphospho-decaprenol L-rhamnosyltransferase